MDRPPLGKSQFTEDETVKYATDHSYKLLPVQEKLMKETMSYPGGRMMGAVEVIQLCSATMKHLNCKNALDVGLFTGFSALSWALVIPEDGRVVSMDINDQPYNDVGKKYVQEAGVTHKIDIRIQPALKTLDDLIAAGESGKFDFAFIDAAKEDYPGYYEKCMQLIRPGGFIAVDNALMPAMKFHGPPPNAPNGMPGPPKNFGEGKKGIDKMNKMIMDDPRVNAVLLPIATGLNLVYKKQS